ncbi:MAG: D-sedoheptulose 7-phosphate isomerase [Flavobacteriales bacterium]|nr:D-sedoheptulose 7-phosphate isomerase [Saprospiraceae bacterium]MCB9187648.1 D-sedoheptulose 7-phosphate isomerase [Flavobacteriales bacterium]
MNISIRDIITKSIQTKEKILGDPTILEQIQSCVDVIVAALESGNKILFCGNGGSAADAQHLSAELTGRFYKNRKSLPSDALHCNTSYLTAVANDYGYEHVYSRLLEGIGKSGDILVCLSTSGNSVNLLRCMEKASEMSIKNIAFTGSSGGLMLDKADICLRVPSNDTPRIQESHIMIGHIICELVESTLFPE